MEKHVVVNLVLARFCLYSSLKGPNGELLSSNTETRANGDFSAENMEFEASF